MRYQSIKTCTVCNNLFYGSRVVTVCSKECYIGEPVSINVEPVQEDNYRKPEYNDDAPRRLRTLTEKTDWDKGSKNSMANILKMTSGNNYGS